MQHFLSALWNGLPPMSDNCSGSDAETKHILYLIERHQQSLYSSITKEQREIFQKYTECYEEYLSHLTERAFCRGFSSAVLFLGEAIFGDN